MAAYCFSRYRSIQRTSHHWTYGKRKKWFWKKFIVLENGMVKTENSHEFDRLFKEVVNGLKKCKEIGKIPVSMGVDTWGVDFVLLDKNDNVLGNTVGYRDHRTEGMDKEVYKAISLKDLYKNRYPES